MNYAKKFFFMAISLVMLSAASVFFFDTECLADNSGTYYFDITHSPNCACGNNNVYTTVISGSTHTYEIKAYKDISFETPIWNCEPFNSTISIDGITATITFDSEGTHTIFAGITDANGTIHYPKLTLNVVDQFFDDAYLNICTKKGDTVSITPQFLIYSTDYPTGALTTITEYITWDTSEIESMNPYNSNNTLTFMPTQTGKYSISATYNLPSSENTNDNIPVTTRYTILVFEKEVTVGENITSTGQQNEYIYFTPDITGRYKINWHSYSNFGNESLYDSDGNQLSGINDYLGGYWLSEGETYFMELYYKNPTNSNFYSINLYNTEDDSSSSLNPSDQLPNEDTGSSSKPAPSVPSRQPAQGITAGDTIAGNSSSVQPVTVSKVKGKPKLKIKNRKIKLTFKKVNGANGYEVRYATNKKFKKSKKVIVSSPKATLKKLKKGKKYFIKVRAFKQDSSSQKVYGAYSKISKIIMK